MLTRNAYYQQQLYVLNSLSEVKSILLVSDIPASARLMTQLFAFCFDAVAAPSQSQTGERLSHNIEMSLTSILITLADESEKFVTWHLQSKGCSRFKTGFEHINGMLNFQECMRVLKPSSNLVWHP